MQSGDHVFVYLADLDLSNMVTAQTQNGDIATNQEGQSLVQVETKCFHGCWFLSHNQGQKVTYNSLCKRCFQPARY